LVLLAACAGTSKPNAAATATTSATTPATAATTTATTAASAIDYGNQYLSIVAPDGAAITAFDTALKALGNNPTGADVARVAAPLIAAANATDEALQQDQWPPNVQADIKALVHANSAFVDDLDTADTINQQNFSGWAGQLISDGAAQMAASSNVRADLGLPPPQPRD
jgi:hypothetical protein